MANKSLSIVLSGKDELSTKLDAVRSRMDEITNSGKPLKRQMRELQQIMADMNLNGLTNNDVFTQLAQQAGSYKDAISDAAAATSAFADDTLNLSAMTQAFSGLSGAVSVATGLTSMLGSENEDLNRVLKAVQGSLALVNGAQAVANALNKDSALMHKIKQIRLVATTAAQRASAVSTTAAAAATGVETAAVGASTVAHTAWNVTVAVGKALFGDLSGLLLLAATGVTIYAAATASATKEQEAQADTTSKQADALKNYQNQVSTSAGELTGKFAALRAEWNTLRTEGGKTEFLARNKKFLNEVGIATDDLRSAENAFAANTGKVVKAIQLRAQAMAAQQGIMEAYKRYMEKMQALDSVAGGKLYTKVKEYSGPKTVTDATGWANKGLVLGKDYNYIRDTGGNYYSLTASGLSSLTVQENAQRNAEAALKYRANSQKAQTELDRDIKYLTGQFESATRGLNEMGLSLHESSKGRNQGARPGARSRTHSQTAGAQKNSPLAGSIADIDARIADEEKRQRNGRMTGAQLTASTQMVTALKKQKEELIGILKAVQMGGVEMQPSANSIVAGEVLQTTAQQTFDPKELTAWRAEQVLNIETTNELNEAQKSLQQTLQGMTGEVGSMSALWVQLAEVMGNQTATAYEKAGAAMYTAGQAMKALGADGAVAKIGAVAAAVGQIILGFAQVSAQAASLGPFGWLAWMGVGLGALATTISTVKGFADGGIIQGTSYRGDAIMARVNAGEMILNRNQQANLFRLLDKGTPGASSLPRVIQLRASGPDLVGVIEINNDKMGRV